MKRLQRILGFDDQQFADFMAGLAGGLTLTAGLFFLHWMGWIG